MLKRYVAGFLFDDKRELVALIRKARPAWQAGKLNGVGGHIEDGESPEAAMTREFQEETGSDGFAWRRAARLAGAGFEVFFFAAFAPLDRLIAVKNTATGDATGEAVELHIVWRLPIAEIIGNLRWLIPLCLDKNNLVAEVNETAGWTDPT
jgi:8-oxo-dGTP diphosphatase